MKVLKTVLLSMMLASPMPASVRALADKMPAPAGILDDKDDAWTWNGAKEIADPNCTGQTGQALSGPAFGVCVFHGTGAALYGMTGTSVVVGGKEMPFGKARIMIDGHLKDTISVGSSETAYGHKIFEVTGLKDGNHVIEVRSVGGGVVIDYLKPLTGDTSDTPDATPKAKHAGAIYTDTFAAGANDWEPFGGSHQVIDGHYVLQGAWGDKAVEQHLRLRDFAYSCDIAMSAGNESGLIFRVTNPAVGGDVYYGYYVGFDLGGRRVMLGKSANAWSQITAAPYPLEANKVYTVKVVAIGSQLNVYINGQFVVGANDNTYPEGTIGVRVVNSTAAFSNLFVTAP